MTITQPPLVLLTVVALLPALLCWVSGRRLARRLDDPLLPEVLLAHRRRNGVAFVLAFAGLAYLWSAAVLWTLPLLVASVLAAGYPLRRVLYDERWSFGTYLGFFGRVTFGWFTFWVLLLATPYLASKAGDRAWLAGMAFGALLLMWNARHAEIMRWCLGTKPLGEGTFLARCRTLAMACDAPVPRFEVVDLQGGVVANALALPSLSGSSVLFTDTLLSRLTEDEAAAICAHELAHLEYYNTRRLRHINLVNYGLIAVAVVTAPLARLVGVEPNLVPLVIFYGLFLTALLVRAKDKQKQETVCDARAVALTGDPEPLVQALTKLYAIARMPRRIEVRQEQSDTHPSLARRIRDLRKIAGVAPAALVDAASFTSADGRTVVTFEDEVIRWSEPGVTHTFSYGSLVDLRVDVRRTNRPTLIARGVKTRRWEMGIAPADVSRVQDVLDRVDGKLSEHRPAAKRPVEFGRMSVAFVAMVTLMMGQIAVAFVALLAWIRPATRLLVAAGAAAMTAAALTLRDDSAGPATMIISSILAGAGAVLLVMAFARRRDTSPDGSIALAALAAAAVLTVPLMVVNGADAIRLHQAAQRTPSAAVLLVALASAFACSRTRHAKVTAIAAAVLASCTVGAASPTFLDRFGSDPFLVATPPLAWTPVGPAAGGEFQVPITTSRIWLAADGRTVAALQQSEAVERAGSNVHLYTEDRKDQAPMVVTAHDVAFVDDNHVVLIESDAAGTSLRAMTLSPPHEVTWQHRIANLQDASLELDRTSRRWRVTGWDDEVLTATSGVVGTADTAERRWRTESVRFTAIEAITTAGPQPLVVESTYDHGVIGRWLTRAHPLWAAVLLPYTNESHYSLLGDSGKATIGQSRLGADCRTGAWADGAIVCTVYDGTRSRFVRIDAVTGTVSGIGYVEGLFIIDHSPQTGWLVGWAEAVPVAIDLTAGRIMRVPKAAGIVGHLTIAGQQLAAVSYSGATCTVRAWRLP